MRYSVSAGLARSGARSGALVVCEPADRFSAPRRRVLIVDDDVAALEAWALLLVNEGVQVEVAPGAEACLRLAGERAFDLIVIDLQLGDDDGLEVMRRLQARGRAVPFVLATGHASVPVTVAAMRLGARMVLEKPLVGDDFVVPVLRELHALGLESAAIAPVAGLSVGHRWARYVLDATNALHDPRTLADWARVAGVSRSTLVEACARIDVNPRDARDLARVLRIVRRVSDPWEPDAALNVADRRTLRQLMIRAGLAGSPQGSRPTPQQCLTMQRFVPQTNAGLAMLRQLVGG